MREIKFRAWDKIKKRMINVGDITFKVLLQEKPQTLIDGIVNTDPVVMQYTGLKDKNGKEIYEKDSREEYSFIDFCNHCFGYQEFYPYEGKNICHNCDGNYDIRDIDFSKETIIGNIYENPELLK